MRFTEEEIRLIARITAEETHSFLSRPRLSAEAQPSGARAPIAPFPIDLSSAGTIELGGPLRSIAVLDGGHPSVTLRLWGYDKRSLDVQAVPGLAFPDVPIERAQVVVPSGLSGTLRVAWSDLPFAIAPSGPSRADWTPFEVTSTEQGADTDLDLGLTAGLEYEVFAAYFRLHADGTAATRMLNVITRDLNDNMISNCRISTGAGSGERGLLIVSMGGAGGILAASGNPGVGVNVRWTHHAHPRRHLVVTAAPTTSHFTGHVESGQAGDTAELVVTGVCRPLSARSVP